MYVMNVIEVRDDKVIFHGFEELNNNFYFHTTASGGIFSSSPSNITEEICCNKIDNDCRDEELLHALKEKNFQYGNFIYTNGGYIAAFGADKMTTLQELLENYRRERNNTCA